MLEKVPVLTIDGPVASGKGTVASILAQRLGWHLLDSGALYRLTALSAERCGVAFHDEVSLAQLAAQMDVHFVCRNDNEPASVFLEGEPVEQAIRSETCGKNASIIAKLVKVRTALIDRQRAFARLPGLVADGRDMGSVIFSDAPCKVFLTATVAKRAQRRFAQLQARGYDANLAHLLEEIAKRDHSDCNRSVAPLKATADAVVMDSTKQSVEEIVSAILQILTQKGLIS